MLDWTINCQTFLRLTGADFGDYGSYQISADGVSSTLTAETIESCRLLDPTEAAALLDFIETARLPFPTTATRLMEWVDQQIGDFNLPDWFRSAATAPNVKEALAGLSQSQDALDRQVKELADKSVRTVADSNAAELQTELEALDSLRFALTAAANTKQSRFDDMSREIEAVSEELGSSASASEVMTVLRSYAGKLGSCVTGVSTHGVYWRRSDGEKEELTSELLRKRLFRKKNGR